MENVKMYFHAFEGEAKIPTVSYPQNFTTKTGCFSPLPDHSNVFYFEVCHAKVSNEVGFGNHYLRSAPVESESTLVLKLIKQSTSKFNPSLTMDVDVKVYYSDGSLFKIYESQSNIKCDQMKHLTFETIVRSIQIQVQTVFSSTNNHSQKMMKGYLTIKCRMLFHDTSKSANYSKETNFSNNLITIYESNVFKDFIFNVDDVPFPVHKVILAAHSPVFMKMWSHDCLETKENCVAITDTTPEIFGMFIKYLYSGEIEDRSWPSVKDLYYLADKYDVGTLRNDCTAIATSFLSLDLICDILKLAYTYNDFNLKLAAKNFAVNHIRELIAREDWNKLVAMQPLIGYEIIVNFVPQ